MWSFGLQLKRRNKQISKKCSTPIYCWKPFRNHLLELKYQLLIIIDEYRVQRTIFSNWARVSLVFFIIKLMALAMVPGDVERKSRETYPHTNVHNRDTFIFWILLLRIYSLLVHLSLWLVLCTNKPILCQLTHNTRLVLIGVSM